MRLAAAALLLTLSVNAQFGPGPAPPRAGKAAALYDITGFWVSVVTEDWRYRMVTPLKGDYNGILLNAAGRKIADAWDPAKDEAAGEQCKSYGAPAIMRVPGHLRITWQDDNTLRIDADNGEQTRLLRFNSAETGAGDWQGYSKASWELVPAGRGVAPVGSLKVVTTRLRPGYLRKNGVPYSASTTLTEYLDRANEPDGNAYLVVTTTVQDPVYLFQPFVTSSHYRKQQDSAGWKPRPCSVK
jgi:hypothetical protein